MRPAERVHERLVGGGLDVGGRVRRRAGAERVHQPLAHGLRDVRQRLRELRGADQATSAPSAATPNVPPTIRVIDSVPDATPALARSTAFIAAVLIGDIVKPIPTPSRMNGVTRKRVRRVDLDPATARRGDGGDEQQSRHQRRARADAVGEAPGERGRDHDHERVGRKRTPVSSGP